MTVTGHETRDVFERYNIVSEQDRRDVAARNAGRLPVAIAVGDTKAQRQAQRGKNLRCGLSRRGRKCGSYLVDDTGLEPVTSGM
jgi:hypothetical protein